MPSWTRTRPTAPAPLPSILQQIQTELAGTQEQAPPPPTRWQRFKGWLWVRRRSHGLPLALTALVWVIGWWVRSDGGPPGWGVAVVGWFFLVAVWMRAEAAHFVHTMCCAAFAVAWLVLAALS